MEKTVINLTGHVDPARTRSLTKRLTYTGLLLAGITACGLLVRLLVVHSWISEDPTRPQRLIGDEPGYDNIAREVLSGFGFTWPGRAPLYPLWLALVYAVAGKSYEAVPYAQIVLGVSVIPLTYLLGRRAFNDSVALMAATCAAFSYILIHQSLHLLSEVLYTPLLLLVGITLLDAFERPHSWKHWAIAGACAGLSTLARPALLAFPLFMVVVLLIRMGNPGGVNAAVRAWLAFSTAFVLMILPWMTYLYVRFHAVIAMQTSNAILWQGSPEYYHLTHDMGYSYMRVWSEILYGPGWKAHDPTSVAGDKYWTARAIRSIAAEPFVYLKFAVEKLGTFWLGDPAADWNGSHVWDYKALRAIGFNATDAAQYVIARVLPLAALVAAAVLWREWRRLLPLHVILIYFTLLHAMTHAEGRLSDPLQPFLLILICGLIHRLYRRFPARPATMKAG